MSEIKGKRIECDRCGRSVFLKKIRDVNHDGGFSPSTEEFESLPKQWLWESQIGHLCDHCGGLFRAFVNKFMEVNYILTDRHNEPIIAVAPSWKLQDEDIPLLDQIEIKEKF